MLIPTGTDAPIYHLPMATIGLIVVNSVVFVWSAPSDPSMVEPWVLAHGQVNPVQWFTSIFIHGGIVHLVGNMLFLWAFGLVVEGKVGSLRFLLIYLFIGVTQSAIEQLMMVGSSGPGSVGASAAIYGLMAMAMVWAPKNELSLVFVLLFRPFWFEVPIVFFCFAYIASQLLLAAATQFGMSAALLHLMGAAIGGPLGFAMLRWGWVDCEGFDLISMLRGKDGNRQPDVADIKDSRPNRELERQRVEEGQKLLANLLRDQNADAAMRLFGKLKAIDHELQWTRPQLISLVNALLREKQWTEAASHMDLLISRFPADSTPVRLRLAQVLVVQLQRPGKAFRVLQPIEPELLTEKQRRLRKAILSRAEQLQHEGIVELQDD